MSIVSTVGIDLAKNVFSVHGVDVDGVVLDTSDGIARKARAAGSCSCRRA